MLRLDLCHLCLLVINFSFIFLTWRRKETNKYELSCPHKACRMHIEKEKKKRKNKRKENEKEKMGVYDSVIILHKKFIHLHSAAMGCEPLFQLN